MSYLPSNLNQDFALCCLFHLLTASMYPLLYRAMSLNTPFVVLIVVIQHSDCPLVPSSPLLVPDPPTLEFVGLICLSIVTNYTPLIALD